MIYSKVFTDKWQLKNFIRQHFLNTPMFEIVRTDVVNYQNIEATIVVYYNDYELP